MVVVVVVEAVVVAVWFLSVAAEQGDSSVVECWAHDQKVAGWIAGRNSGGIFFSS